MNKNLRLINNLESYIDRCDKINTQISHQNIGWHIAHSCRVINAITKTLISSNPENAKPRFNVTYYKVILTNYIPRGKAKAPSFVNPSDLITKEEVLADVAQAKESIALLSKAGRGQYFTHPGFGDLNRNKTLTFLAVHTNHHLKIIKDI
jgi:hypothetical protein